MRQQALSSAIALLLAATEAAPSHPKCRCRPSEPCWPSTTEWQSLNTSIDGNLVAVRPFAYVCHDPTFSDEECKVATRNSNESLWLSANPGAVQHANWASRPEKNETCYIGTGRSVPCGQGRISLFSAVVRKTEHIQAAIRFVAKHNVRLAIKNTGHCFLGRSSAPESLQILTHNLKSIDFTDDFKPKGRKDGKGSGPAVTIGAGIQLKELYTALGERNLTAVIGLAHTVGAAGGYIQGGGHSPLGTWKGMSADNALEFTVVNAKGDVVVANDYQNKDLFWALRGGGGGSWGVVVNVTIRTFPDPPAIIQTVNFLTPNITAFWAVIEDLHARLPAINEAGGGGYYFMTPGQGGNSSLALAFLFTGQTNETAAAKVMDPWIAVVNRTIGASSAQLLRLSLPQTKYFIQEALPAESDTEGGIIHLGSRLISRDFLARPGGAAALVDTFQAYFESNAGGGPDATITGHVVAGGQVARNKDLDVAVNPAWRRTLTHVAFGVSWPKNATVAEQRAAERLITDVQVPLFKRLEPDMGAYLNEADANERDFQQSFWGSNYARLRKVKAEWDPEGIFITNAGVGSEDWGVDGLCRV